MGTAMLAFVLIVYLVLSIGLGAWVWYVVRHVLRRQSGELLAGFGMTLTALVIGAVILNRAQSISEARALAAARNAGFSSIAEQEAARSRGYASGAKYHARLAAEREQHRIAAEKRQREQDLRERAEAERRARAERDAEMQCKRDLQCWGDRYAAQAGIVCREPVEQLANFDFEWTDGFLESKFYAFRWLEKSSGRVTYLGDRIKFQNGFGAWQRHTYACDFDPASGRVLAVRAYPGRLHVH